MSKERKLKKAMNLIYGREGLGTGFKDIHGKAVRPGGFIKHVRYAGGVCVEDCAEIRYYSKVAYFPSKASFGVIVGEQFVPLYALVNVEVIE